MKQFSFLLLSFGLLEGVFFLGFYVLILMLLYRYLFDLTQVQSFLRPLFLSFRDLSYLTLDGLLLEQLKKVLLFLVLLLLLLFSTEIQRFLFFLISLLPFY